MPMMREGEVVDYYTLVNRLGRNAFGEVWSARESITDRILRITFLGIRDPHQVARFRRAVSMHARLNHPAIIAHTGSGNYQDLPYQSTESVQGPTLATLLTQGGRMDELKVLQLAVQVAAGLDHAWSTSKIIHRNLTPDTILVDLSGMQEGLTALRIKIIDFGHALGKRSVDSDDREAVAAEAAFQAEALKEIVGTPMTMSPEQIQGKPLTVASDMYALGVVMYVLLTGKPPFSGTDAELRTAHLKANPLDLAQVVPGLNPGTASLVRKLLGKSPEARFPDWEQFRQKAQQLVEQIEQRRQPKTARFAPGQARTADKAPEAKQPSAEPSGGHRMIPAIPAIPSLGAAPRPGAPGSGAPGGGHAAGGGGYAAAVGATGPIDERILLAALADRLRTNPAGMPPASALVANHPVASHVPATTQGPAVDDGLNTEQRAAIWAFLFRNPAILEATVTGEQAAAQNPTTREYAPSSLDGSVHVHAPAAHPAPAPAPPAEQVFAIDLPALPSDGDEPEPASDAPAFADLLNAIDTTAPAGQSEAPPPAEGEPEVARNPLQSPFWKPALELLRIAIIGKVRHQAGGDGLTRLISTRLRRLVASRESKLAEVGTLLDGGRFDEAMQLLDQVSGPPPSEDLSTQDAITSLLRARAAALRNDFANALRWAQNAVQKHHPEPTALALVGYAQLHTRRAKTAIAVFDETARVHPTSPLGPLGQATILFLAGLDTKAGAVLDEARERTKYPPLIQLAALRCRAHEDPDGEIAELKLLLTGTPDDWDIKQRIQEISDGGGGRPGTRTFNRG